MKFSRIVSVFFLGFVGERVTAAPNRPALLYSRMSTEIDCDEDERCTTEDYKRPLWYSGLSDDEAVRLETRAGAFSSFRTKMLNKYHPHYCHGHDRDCDPICSYSYGQSRADGLKNDCMTIPDCAVYDALQAQVEEFERKMQRKYRCHEDRHGEIHW